MDGNGSIPFDKVLSDELDLLSRLRLGAAPDRPADKNAPQFSENACAVGRLIYPDCDPGTLIYVKSALTEGAPVDIRQYRAPTPPSRTKAPPTSASTKTSPKPIATWLPVGRNAGVTGWH